jgi:hypothetical protein
MQLRLAIVKLIAINYHVDQQDCIRDKVADDERSGLERLPDIVDVRSRTGVRRSI